VAQKVGDEACVHSAGSGERPLSLRAWEEDIVVYGGLASM
jgi:hypothetical protein